MWFVAQTRKDQLARDELRKQNFSVMMPTEPRRRVIRGQVAYDRRPMFPGYIFVAFAWADKWRAINSTRGVRRLMGNESPQPLSEEAAQIIVGYCNIDEPHDTDAMHLLNTLVRVVDGAFGGFEGECTEIDGDIGLVEVTVFGRKVPTRVPLCSLASIE